MVCAYTANDMQLLSRGRFILGLGTQIRPHIERRFSETWSKPNPRMREFVRAIRAIWRSGRRGVGFPRRLYTHTLVRRFQPRPNPLRTAAHLPAGFGASMTPSPARWPTADRASSFAEL
jgi:alkanesulfonate monooxygenase SsuD/methylene tetrahydromethanopterin reductase-like flavin-dependent oxidoreductase (luciferase family)